MYTEYFIDESVRHSFGKEIKSNVYLQHLDGLLKHRPLDIHALLEYGLKEVVLCRKNEALAMYFFYLSELAFLASPVQSFALDVSEYLHGMFENDASYQDFKPFEEYIKIKPLLNEK